LIYLHNRRNARASAGDTAADDGKLLALAQVARLKIKPDFILGPRAFHAAAIISDERRFGGEVKRSRSR
jgi:hypothetical protein